MSDKVLEILKKAILIERRGKAFYAKVAETTPHQAVKSFFMDMVKEEDLHIEELTRQYQSLVKSGKLAPPAKDNIDQKNGEKILSDQIKKEISGASYEAAAISAAISMEKAAFELYRNRAREAQSEEEIKLYDWLSKWEDGHLNALIAIDKELQEKIWYDNSFWPM